MLALARLFRRLHRSTRSALEGIPGPVPTFPFGNALDFVGKLPWQVCADYAHTYGPLTLIWLGSKPVLVLNDPQLIGQVLDTSWESFYKDTPVDALLPILGPACPFLANNPDWRSKRASHPFSAPDLAAWLASQVGPMSAALLAGLQRLAAASAAQPVDLLEAMQRLSFDVFSVAVWGKQLPSEIYHLFVALGRFGDHRIKSPLSFVPPLLPEFWLARSRWRQHFTALLREARHSADRGGSELIQVVLRRGTPLGEDALRDVMANIFFGGVFSVASCLTTALYLLARHPHVERRLRTEAAGRVGPGGAIGLAELEGWDYLDGVLREALRYLPPVPFYARNVQKTGPVAFAGRSVPADTLLFITNVVLHRSPAHYTDPDHFDPERWAPGAGLRERTPLGSDYFFPFGRGPRTCVGMPFALTYMKLALALLAGSGRVEVDLGRCYRQSFFFGVMMPRGLTARFLRG